MFSVMLMDAYRDERPGIRIAYRMDGQLFNQRRMHFQSRVSATSVHKLLFAAVCDNFRLIVNTEKTMVMHQLPPHAAYIPPQINVNGTQLQAMESLT
nr:unnamed protein product [Spirometra erinaceieuropaei]